VYDIWANEPDIEQLRRLHALLRTDAARALNGLEGLAERGSLMSMLYIANAFSEGVGVRADPQQSEQWYRKAADCGSMLARYELGRLLLKREEYRAAQEAFERGMSQNHAPSIHMLALMYLRGQGVSKDKRRARELLEKSASLGHVFSKRNLGVLLMSGDFGPTQRLRGVSLFLSALRDAAVVVPRDPTSNQLR